MNDIFIGYSHNDRSWVEPFAKALETHGWAVWWDRDIPAGESLSALNRRELAAANCVIVVWSEQSVESRLVQAAAEEAKQLDKYLSVKIDQCEVPPRFIHPPCQSLVNWESGVDHAGFTQLLKDIEQFVKCSPRRIENGSRAWWKRIHPFWLVSSAAALAAAVVVIGLWLWPLSVPIQVELTTERVQFQIGETGYGKARLDGFDAQSIAIEKFAAVAFEPARIEVADPSQYQVNTDDFPSSAWRRLSVGGSKVSFEAKDRIRHPRLTVEGLNTAGQATVHLDPLTVTPGTHVTLEARRVLGGEKVGFTMELTSQPMVTLSIPTPFKVIADHTELRDMASPFPEQDELTYRVTLSEQASWVAITTLPEGLTLSPTFAVSQSPRSFFGGIPVVAMDLTKQNASGDRVSALTGEGTISSPKYPDLIHVSLKEGEAIGLERLDKFTIERITLQPDGRGMKVVGYGLVDQVHTRRGDISIPHRVTALKALLHNQELQVFAAIGSTVLMLIIMAYPMWERFRP